jgi:hypothetical protein
VLVLAVLNSLEYKVSDVELTRADVALMVAPQGLLVLGAAQQCCIPHLDELVGRVLKCNLVSFLGAGPYSRTVVVDVRGKDCFRAMHHEERCEARGSTWRGTHAPQHEG